jgi:hypothetical protein
MVHEGPKYVPRIECPHSSEGSSQVHEGPNRDHGHDMHKNPHFRFRLSFKFSYFHHKMQNLMNKIFENI